MKKILLVCAMAILQTACATLETNEANKEASKSNVDLIELRNEAVSFYNSGQFQKAINNYTVLVEAVPEDALLWFKKGNSHARLNQPVLAVESYQKALLRDPRMFKAWRNMSTMHHRQAMNSLTQLMAVLPVNHPLYESSLKAMHETMSILNIKHKPSGK